VIPPEVLEGETRQHWYPLLGRNANANQNQGDILIVMSFLVNRFCKQRRKQTWKEIGEVSNCNII